MTIISVLKRRLFTQYGRSSFHIIPKDHFVVLYHWWLGCELSPKRLKAYKLQVLGLAYFIPKNFILQNLKILLKRILGYFPHFPML